MGKRISYRAKYSSTKGFTLVELMIVTAVMGILAAIAYPNYSTYIVKSHRNNAQSELLQLASVQEKIFLNSNSYSPTLFGVYNGTAAGALWAEQKSSKGTVLLGTEGGIGPYTLSMVATDSANPPGACNGTTVACTVFVITATPTGGQANDEYGTISYRSDGTKARSVEKTPITNW